MNWLSWLEPKNSFSAATTGRMLMIVCGVIVSRLGGEALAHDALHAVEADAEGLLDQLADGAQAAVAEVLVLVEVVLDGLARHADGLGRVVLHLDLGSSGMPRMRGSETSSLIRAMMSSLVRTRVSRSAFWPSGC